MSGLVIRESMDPNVYRIPDGEGINADLAINDNLITTGGGLMDGMRLMCRTLSGWSVGIISTDSHGQPVCLSESGNVSFFIEFFNDEETSPPRWRCVGIGKTSGIRKLVVG